MFLSVMRTFRINDVIDIFIVTCIIYWVSQLIIETRAAQIAKGIFLLLLSYALANLLSLKTMSLLMENVFQWGIVAIIVLFQPEIRRALERVGRSKMTHFGFLSHTDNEQLLMSWNDAIENVTKAVDIMSKTATGALIVIEKEIRLGDQIRTGIKLDAEVSADLICNVFTNKAPLHDGAMIIREARILSVACYLPKPSNEEYIARELGSRHRAAIGMSENSDAITIVVSEEKGSVSIAENGVLKRGFNKNSLYDYLKSQITHVKDESQPKRSDKKGKKEKKEKKETG